MRLILHIGMPKAGSTALQTALAAARGPLRQRGVLYPKGALNQNFLIAGIAPPGRLGRVYAQQYGDDHAAIARDFEGFWKGIVTAIDSQAPAVVVLSGELLFGTIGDVGPEPVRALLAPLGAKVEIIAYLRRPSDYYLSMAQQRLKASWEMRPVAPIRYRKPLEAARAIADVLHAVPFERESFPGGDVVADFARRLLPETGDLLRAVEDPKVKPSMSAEAMAIVQAYRKEHHPDANNRFTRDTGALMKHLAAEEAALGGQRRPILKPEVRALVDRASLDLLWLRDDLGVRFAGIDYDAIGPADEFAASSVDDVCIVDPVRKAALEATLARLDLPTEDSTPTVFRAGVASAGKPARTRTDQKPAKRKGPFGWW
jgi:hypothetical protein